MSEESLSCPVCSELLPVQYLSLNACGKVTDAGLAHLSSLPLQHLDLSSCEQVTDAGLAHLSSLPLQIWT